MSAYSDLVLASAPAVYYRLGESSGTNAADSSGNARDGTYTNAPTLGVGGIISESDTAVTFANASTQYVAPSYTFNSANATIEAWIKISGAPAAKQLIAGCVNGLGSSVEDKLLYVDTDGKLYAYAYDGNTKTTSAPTATIPTGEWVHTALVADSVNLKAYVNGVEVGTIACGATYTAYTVSNVYVAATGNGPPLVDYFTGSIDEVAFYPSALSVATVLSHYTAGTTPTPQFIHPFNAIPFMGGH